MTSVSPPIYEAGSLNLGEFLIMIFKESLVTKKIFNNTD